MIASLVRHRLLPFLFLLSLGACLPYGCTSGVAPGGANDQSDDQVPILPVNWASIPTASGQLAILHPQIIVGDGQTVISDGAVLIENDRIAAVGAFGEVTVPEDAAIFDATGSTLIPGLIDAHFHLNRKDSLARLFLLNGITSLRDPGAWIADYDKERQAGYLLPRLYLTGPHIDMFPPAYPTNSLVVRDAKEARAAVTAFAARGASAIKIYFKSSLEVIEASCAQAGELGLPVTAHLEITDIYDAVAAGIDGIEHITSLGFNLVSPQEAEAYKQAILEDTNARRNGRYQMWATIDPQSETAGKLANFLAERAIFLCPTLDAFEYQADPAGTDSLRLRAFANMMAYTKRLHDLGVPVVVGSHGQVKYADKNWSFHHEMELFEKLGMQPLEIIYAATLQNARFFRIEDELGSIEAGKIADLVLVEGDPIATISAMRQVKKVMLGGRWVPDAAGSHKQTD